MPTPTNLMSELDRLRAENTSRMEDLVEQQYNTEMTRGFMLRFSSKAQSDAEGLSRLLFAKGLRLLTPEPVQVKDGLWQVLVGVKHSLREVTSEDFVCDLVELASGVNSRFQGWDFVLEESAEQTQMHVGKPGIQS